MNEMQELIVRGMKDFFHASPEAILRELGEGVRSGKYRVFFHSNSAYCIIQLPSSPFEVPQVVHFYSERPGSRGALVSAVLDFIKQSGYTTLRAVNGSGVPDETWVRTFRHKDWNIKPVKTVFDFEVKA